MLSSMGLHHAKGLLNWLISLEQRADFCRETTLLELLVGYRLDTGSFLPIQVSRGNRCIWQDVEETCAGELAPRTIASQLKVFTSLLVSLFDAVDLPLEWSFCSKPDAGIHKSISAIVAPWPLDVDARVRASLSTGRPFRRACDFARPWR